MMISRTKQQIACDGVRIAWNIEDAFTNILQQQVEKNFSIDGIVSLQKNTRSEVVSSSRVVKKAVPLASSLLTTKRFKKSVDGIRLPWQEACVA